MRNCNEALERVLKTERNFNCCDLFVLALKDGTVIRIADYDIDITYKNEIYRHDTLIVKRDQTKQSGSPTVDNLTVTIYADQNHTGDYLKGEYVLKLAHDGKLDDAQLTLRRAFLNADGTLIGVIDLFVGNCDVENCAGITCTLKAKSEVVGLNTNLPLRIYAAQNTYVTNEDGFVVTSDEDSGTMAVPLKPRSDVLLKF